MNIVQVKAIIEKFTKKGKRQDGTPYTKRCFIGIMEDGEERGISTFAHIEEGKIYEMQLESKDIGDKTYWNATAAKEFATEEPAPKPTPPPKETPPSAPLEPASTYANDAVRIRTDALKCAIMSFQITRNDPKAPAVKDSDIVATAQRLEHYLKTGKWLEK